MSLINKLQEHANKTGIRLNPDDRIVTGVMKGMLRMQQIHGKALCPCRFYPVEDIPSDDHVCPCKSHLEDIAKTGMCHCRLFVKR